MRLAGGATFRERLRVQPKGRLRLSAAGGNLYRYDFSTNRPDSRGGDRRLSSPTSPVSVWFDEMGNFYVSEKTTGEVWQIDLSASTAANPITGANVKPAWQAVTSGTVVVNPDGGGCAVAHDFGNAPDSYGTSKASGGAFDQIDTGIDAGYEISGEQTSRPASALPAETDSNDGVTSFAPFTTATSSYSVTVNITNTTGTNATVAGWIDWNRNGEFGAFTERAFVPPGSTQRARPSPGRHRRGGSRGDVGAVRIYQGAVSNPLPTGDPFGEVEDYPLTIGSQAMTVDKRVDRTVAHAGDVVTYTVAVNNTGSVAINGATFADNLGNVLDDATGPTGIAANTGTATFSSPNYVDRQPGGRGERDDHLQGDGEVGRFRQRPTDQQRRLDDQRGHGVICTTNTPLALLAITKTASPSGDGRSRR